MEELFHCRPKFRFRFAPIFSPVRYSSRRILQCSVVVSVGIVDQISTMDVSSAVGGYLVIDFAEVIRHPAQTRGRQTSLFLNRRKTVDHRAARATASPSNRRG